MKLFAVAIATLLSVSDLVFTQAKGPIKVGVLHPLSGTIAIPETSLRDIALMTIGEINKSGDVLGRKLGPVMVDPIPNWPLLAERAYGLLI